MMNRFYYSLVLFFVLTSLPLVSSAVVGDLDINFLNAPAAANKDLNFQGTWSGGDANVLYWKFDTDTNVVQKKLVANIFLNDDFEDQDISDWNVTSGVWTAAGGNLVDGGSGEIFFDTGADNNWVSDEGGLEVIVDINTFNVAVSILDNNTLATGDGYRLTTSAVELKVQTNISGSTIDILTIVEGSAVGDEIKYTFDINGLITVIKNDVVLDSVVDTNFSSFRYVVVDAQNGGLQSIIVQNLVGTTTSIIESGASQTHTFTTTGQKTIQLTVQNPDGNASTSLDLNITGSLNITVFDENKGFAISGASIDFNSGTYVTPASGNVNIPLGDLTAGEFTISIDVNSDYPQRQFIFDLNEFSSVDLNALMLQTVDGESRSYTIFQPDAVTLITDSIVEWRRTDVIPNGISQRTKTNGSGVLSFFGQNDANYVMRINDTVSNVVRDYNGTIVTVKIPRNISLISQTLTPFNVQVGGLGALNLTGLTGDVTFKIFSDTTNFYTVGVDQNTDFFATSFLVRTLGGKATETINPFLVPQTGNIESIITTISNSTQRRTITDIRIESRTDVNGSLTLVESRNSDITGTAAFHFDIGKEYTLTFFDSTGSEIFSGVLTPKSTDTLLFAFLQEATLSVVPTTVANITIGWFPTVGNLKPDADGNVSVFQIVNAYNTVISDINVVVSNITDTNIVYSQVFTVNGTDVNLAYEIDVNGMNRQDILRIQLNIFDTNGFLIKQAQSVGYTLFATDVIDAADLVKRGLGSVLSVFVAVLISFIVIAFVTSKSIGEDLNFIGIGAFLLTGIFVMLGFIEFNTWAFATLLGIGLMLLGARGK